MVCLFDEVKVTTFFLFIVMSFAMNILNGS